MIYFYVLRDFLRDCTYGAARGVFLDPIFLACLAIMPKCLAAPVPVGVVEWGRVILARFKLQLSSFTFSTSFPLPRTKKCSLVITSSPSPSPIAEGKAVHPSTRLPHDPRFNLSLIYPFTISEFDEETKITGTVHAKNHSFNDQNHQRPT